MTADELRAVVRRSDSLAAIRAAAATGALAVLLPTPFFDHVAAVYARLECTLAATDDDAWPLKLAVLVHEEPPRDAATLLARAGFGDVSGLVERVLAGFGAIWKARTDDDVAAYVRAEAAHLAELLRFEVAHEGGVTAAMIDAARLAGLEAALATWTRRLADPDRDADTREYA